MSILFHLIFGIRPQIILAETLRLRYNLLRMKKELGYARRDF